MDRTRRNKILIAALVAIFCIFAIGAWLGAWHSPEAAKFPDSDWYIKIANGDIKDVPQPFASRVLNPAIVHLVSSVSNLGLDFSFYIVNALLLLGFVFVLSLFFSEISFMNPLLVFIVLFAPFLMEYHLHFYMSDALFGFLAILFLFFLKKKNIVLGLVFLFLLFFSRATDAIIFGTILIAISLYKKEMKLVWAASAVVLIGYLINSQVISALGAANIHNISDSIYRLLEPLYYFVRNVLGIDWMVTAQVQYCQVQHFIYLPGWIHLGNLKWIGICDFNIINPLSVILYAFTTFGLIPFALFSALRKFISKANWRQFFAKNETWLLVALGYGLLLFFLGLLVPNLRTASYGWPAFWLAGFYILDRQIRQWPVEAAKGLVKLFVVFQIVLLWSPYLIIQSLPHAHNAAYLAAFLVTAIIYFIFIRAYSAVAKKYNLSHNLQMNESNDGQ
jgi:hypothetical protein